MQNSTIKVTLILLFFILIFITIYYGFLHKETSTIIENTNEIELRSINIPTLNLGHYALWWIDKDNSYFLIKRFNIKKDSLVGLDGKEFIKLSIQSNPADIIRLEVTIEQEGDRDTIPNKMYFLQGIIDNNQCVLNVTAALKDLDKSAGSFILSSPSDGNSEINEASGIWFINEDGSPALSLPVLSDTDWIYSGKIILDNDSLNIGNFKKPFEKDNSSIYSNLEGTTFDTPGEDFLTNLPDSLSDLISLTNGKTIVEISIQPDNQNLTFSKNYTFLPILQTKIPINYKPHKEIEMDNKYMIPKLIILFQ